MRKSKLFDCCVHLIDQLLRTGKIKTATQYAYGEKAGERLSRYIRSNNCSGIVISTVEGVAGMITRAWGIVFIDPDSPYRCTDIHTSYYGEGVALEKLYKELEKLQGVKRNGDI